MKSQYNGSLVQTCSHWLRRRCLAPPTEHYSCLEWRGRCSRRPSLRLGQHRAPVDDWPGLTGSQLHREDGTGGGGLSVFLVGMNELGQWVHMWQCCWFTSDNVVAFGHNWVFVWANCYWHTHIRRQAQLHIHKYTVRGDLQGCPREYTSGFPLDQAG